MPLNLPGLQAARGGWPLLLRIFVVVLVALASIQIVSHYGRTMLSVSGDEYYFYYAASGPYIGVASDPIWAMQSELDSAEGQLQSAGADDAQCRRATAAARGDLNELSFLLQMESRGQGYGPGSQLQGLALRAWNVMYPPTTAAADQPGWGAQLGERIAATIALPMALLIAACLLVASFSRHVVVPCALGLYVLLHGLLPPAPEAYWAASTENLESAWWIMKSTVLLPFVNPRYSDSLVAIAPRGYLVLPFLLALACRWAGATRWSYALLATLPLFHVHIGTMIFAMVCAVDLLARPRVFADRWVSGLAIAALAYTVVGPAGALFLELAGSPQVVAMAAVALAAAMAYAVFMPRHAGFQAWNSWVADKTVLLDVLVFGPLFMLLWLALAILHAHFGVITGYGLVNLATKSGAVAHQVFFFGLFCLCLGALLRWLTRWLGERWTVWVLLFATSFAAVLVALLMAQRPAGPHSLLQRFALIVQAHDTIVRERPLQLGNFETHLMWHRIVRQRETGGDWVTTAIDLSPFRAACPLLSPGEPPG